MIHELRMLVRRMNRPNTTRTAMAGHEPTRVSTLLDCPGAKPWQLTIIHPSNQKHVHRGGNRDTNDDTGGNFHSGVTHMLPE